MSKTNSKAPQKPPATPKSGSKSGGVKVSAVKNKKTKTVSLKDGINKSLKNSSAAPKKSSLPKISSNPSLKINLEKTSKSSPAKFSAAKPELSKKNINSKQKVSLPIRPQTNPLKPSTTKASPINKKNGLSASPSKSASLKVAVQPILARLIPSSKPLSSKMEKSSLKSSKSDKEKIKKTSYSGIFSGDSAPNLLDEDTSDPGLWRGDEVYDETDQAQYLQLCEMAEITRRIREMNRPQTHPDFDGVHCIDCDIEIPPRRLAITGCIRCVDCQELVELKSKRL